MQASRNHPAQSTADHPEGWPLGVRPISIDGLDHLGVGDDGTLYWDGKPVEVRKALSLTFWQRLGAVLVTVAAVAGAIAAGVSAYADFVSIPTTP